MQKAYYSSQEIKRYLKDTSFTGDWLYIKNRGYIEAMKSMIKWAGG